MIEVKVLLLLFLLFFNVFFNYDLDIRDKEKNVNDNSSRIHDYFEFYKSIDFKECFRIVSEKQNEQIAIKLLHFLKHSINDLKLNILGKKLLNEKFNLHFHTFLLKRFFDLNWCDAIEFALDIIGESDGNLIGLVEKKVFKSDETFIDLDFLSDFEDFIKKLKSKPNQTVPLDENKNSDDLFNLIINSENIDEEKQNLFLKHPATEYLLLKKWSFIPLIFYYSNLFLFLLFLLFYSINIEIYTRTEKTSGLNVTCKCMCFLNLLYLILLEIVPLLNLFHELYACLNEFYNCINTIS